MSTIDSDYVRQDFGKTDLKAYFPIIRGIPDFEKPCKTATEAKALAVGQRKEDLKGG